MNSNNNSNDLQLLNTLHARMLSTIFAKTISEEEMMAFIRAKEALEKQIPNYVSIDKFRNDYDWECNKCNLKFCHVRYTEPKPNYCPYCGQRLKWD